MWSNANSENNKSHMSMDTERDEALGTPSADKGSKYGSGDDDAGREDKGEEGTLHEGEGSKYGSGDDDADREDETEEGEVVGKQECSAALMFSDYNGRERCYIHHGGKHVNRACWLKDGRDKCACIECLEEKRRFLEDVEYAHLPEAERKLQTYLRMGAFFCTPCIRLHIMEGRSFVRVYEDGSVKGLIACAKACVIPEHKVENNKKLCDCEGKPNLWMRCKICADHNPRAGTIYCRTCKHLKLSVGHRQCPEYVPKTLRYRVKQRVLNKKPPAFRATKPTLAQLLVKERGILVPLAMRTVAVGPLGEPLSGPLPGPLPGPFSHARIGGGGGAFAPRVAAQPQHAMIAAFQASMEREEEGGSSATKKQKKTLDTTSPQEI